MADLEKAVKEAYNFYKEKKEADDEGAELVLMTWKWKEREWLENPAEGAIETETEKITTD